VRGSVQWTVAFGFSLLCSPQVYVGTCFMVVFWALCTPYVVGDLLSC